MYFERGDCFIPTNEANTIIHNQLPPGNYTVKVDQNGNFYFQSLGDFSIPSRIYGDTVRTAERILNTFEDRSGSTGALFTGEKGSGKSMLAKLLSVMGKKKKLPTIVINHPFTGDKFNQLIQELPEAILLFDEFEKVYSDRDDQKLVLTLLDGVFPSKKLFLFTSNDKYSIDAHMHNRPGRIFYSIDYNGLGLDFIKEYCEENLNDKSRIENILHASSLFESFNFDMLQALVQEMNRYNESPYDALKLLNIRPSNNEGSYSVKVVFNGETIPTNKLDDVTIRGNPLAREVTYVNFNHGPDDEYIRFPMPRDALISSDIHKGTYVFDNNEGLVLTLTKRVIADIDHYKFMDF